MVPKLQENQVDRNNPGQESCKIEGNNRIKTGTVKDGSPVHVDSSQIRDKSHLLVAFLSREDLQGKFDINHVTKRRSYKDKL